MLVGEKDFSHLPLKTQVDIDEKQDGQPTTNKYIKHVCQLKTLVGLQPFVKYNTKHHRCTYTTPNALDEDAIVDIKQKGCSTTLNINIKLYIPS